MQKMTKQHSRIVTFIAVSVLIIGLIQLWQAWGINSRSPIAISYGVSSIQLQVRSILTLLWGCIWIWQAFQLYRHQQSNRAWFQLSGTIIFYTLYRLILVVISPSIIDQQRWVVGLILAIVALVAILSERRRIAHLN